MRLLSVLILSFLALPANAHMDGSIHIHPAAIIGAIVSAIVIAIVVSKRVKSK